MSSYGGKYTVEVICYENGKQVEGATVNVSLETSWEDCIKQIAVAMQVPENKYSQNIDVVQVYSETGYSFKSQTDFLDGDSIFLDWEGKPFVDQDSYNNVPVSKKSSPSQMEKRSTVSFTDDRKGSELDQESASERLVMKFIIVGALDVGKSCIFGQFVNKVFNEDSSPTVGVDFNSTIIKVKDRLIKIQIWDTAGQERHRSITKAYFRDTSVAIVVYDVTNMASFKAIDNWIKSVNEICNNANIVFCLCGNKVDSEKQREVSEKKAALFAKERGMLFFETSAKRDINVTKMFSCAAKRVLEKIEKEEIEIDDPQCGVKIEDITHMRQKSTATYEKPSKKCSC